MVEKRKRRWTIPILLPQSRKGRSVSGRNCSLRSGLLALALLPVFDTIYPADRGGRADGKILPQLPPEHPHRVPRHRHGGQRDGAGRGTAAHCAALKRGISPASRIIKQRKKRKKRTANAVRPLARHGVNLCPYEHYPNGYRVLSCPLTLYRFQRAFAAIVSTGDFLNQFLHAVSGLPPHFLRYMTRHIQGKAGGGMARAIPLPAGKAQSRVPGLAPRRQSAGRERIPPA